MRNEVGLKRLIESLKKRERERERERERKHRREETLS